MLPKDKFLLLSFVNTQLRDNYPSLDELTKALNVDKGKLLSDLESIGYGYNEAVNAFR
jgi:hypothetical protein